MISRRHLLIVLGAAAFGPRAVLAQQKQPVLIGWLHPGSRTLSARTLAFFKEEMAALGWKDGSSYVLEQGWAEGRVDRMPSLAKELAAKKPAIIVAVLSGATTAAAKAAPDVPVVQAYGGSPVTRGLAKSLARPGGMVTGVTSITDELSGKYLELLLAAAPKLRRVGFLIDVSSPSYRDSLKNARRAIEQSRVEAHFAEVAKPDELDPAVARLAMEGVQGLVILPQSGWINVERRRILTLALAQRWPVVSGLSAFAVEGALLSYSADRSVLFRRTAYYVDRILRGAKPGDLPIEQPTKFELVLNLKTAGALGLTIPESILVRADRVIE